MTPLEVQTAGGWRHVDLLAYLDAEEEERAHDDAYAWIKAVRHLAVDGQPFRSRFSVRGDSLWWFAELYLHKTQAMLLAMRVIRAIDALIARDRPGAIRVLPGRHAGVIAQAAGARGIACEGPRLAEGRSTMLRLDARAVRLSAAARLSRLRVAGPPRDTAPVAAFVHRAFWRAGGADGSAESYIGPVLRELEVRGGAGAVRYVGVGPRSNFQARRWWDPLTGHDGHGIVAIERYAPAAAMQASRGVYRQRREILRHLLDSADLRAHAVIRGVDCWSIVREQLAGIALLQFPWSVRAMDEAAAALRSLQPDVAVTYAEAGGWGRALALEARRTGVPLVGLQHGFIYRHWLNYRHEPDEMEPDRVNAEDAGFPRPAKTLLFDEHAAAHLRDAGRFPPGTFDVTGSARLDELIAAVRALTPADVGRARQEAGAAEAQMLVVFAGKEREARGALPALVAAVCAMPAVQLAIKPHPAETAEVYAGVTAGAANVRVLRVSTPLPPLLGAAAGLVTKNSTVAIDALTLGVPSLVIGLPNNLTPFVRDGLMLGAGTEPQIREGLRTLLYDQRFRSSVGAGRVARGGEAAARSAAAILALRRGEQSRS
jgi:hypothetical protein